MPIQRITDPAAPRVIAQTPATTQQGTNFGSLGTVLGSWLQQEQQALEQRATRNVQEQAELAQREAGPRELAQSPEGLAQRFRVVYEDQARTVLSQQVKRDASAEAARLRREYWNNPQGFADAWDSFSSGMSEGYKEADPLAASRVQEYLDAFGTQNFDILADQDATRQRQKMATDAVAALNDAASVMQDMLLSNPNDRDFEATLAGYEDGVLDLVERGMITSDAGRSLVRNNQLSTTREFVRGKFQTALNRRDFRGATGVIKSLRRGKWFPDNDQARRLASELERQLDLGAGGAAIKKQVPVLLRELDREYSAVIAGRSPAMDQERLQQIGKIVAAYGTPVQQDDFRTKAASIAYTDAFRNVASQAPEDQLRQSAAQLDQLRQQITPEARGALEAVIEDELDALSSARREGDPAMAGPTIDWGQDTGALLQEVQDRYALVQRRTGTPVQRQPTWKRSEMSAMRDALEQSMDAGDVETTNRILTNYFAPSEGDPARRLADLARLSDGSGDMFLAATMHSFGAPTESATFTNLVAAGREAPVEFLRAVDPSYERSTAAQRVLTGGFFGSGVLDAIDNVAMGNQRVRASMAGAALDAYQGALMQNNGDRDAARAEVTRLFQPLSSGIEFSNGKRLASNLLAGFPAGDKAVAETVDRYLETPSLLGIPEANSQMTERLIPMPLPGGADLGFYDPLSGSYLANPDNPTEPLRVVPGEVLEAEGISEDDPGLFERALEGFSSTYEATFGRVGELQDVNRLHLAVRPTSVPKAMAEAVYFSAQDTPPEEAGPRIGAPLLQPEWEGQFTEEQVRRRLVDTYGNMGNLADPSIFTAEAQIPYASLALEESAKAFPGDPEMQLAMYWLGPDATQALVSTYGQDWMSYVDMSTEMFVSRAMDVLENRPEGTAPAEEITEGLGSAAEVGIRGLIKVSPFQALVDAAKGAEVLSPERRRERAEARRAARADDGGE